MFDYMVYLYLDSCHQTHLDSVFMLFEFIVTHHVWKFSDFLLKELILRVVVVVAVQLFIRFAVRISFYTLTVLTSMACLSIKSVTMLDYLRAFSLLLLPGLRVFFAVYEFIM